jgi:hypothetical protein
MVMAVNLEKWSWMAEQWWHCSEEVWYLVL